MMQRTIQGDSFLGMEHPLDLSEIFDYGKVMWLISKYFPIRNIFGEVVSFVTINEDITELKQYQQHLEEMVQERTNNRVRLKGMQRRSRGPRATSKSK